MKNNDASLIENLLRLKALIHQQRSPINGCPWSRSQTFESLLPNTLEEVYEIIDAVHQKDYLHLKEEIGDLLLHVFFYAEIAEEQGLFDLSSSTLNNIEKQLRRKPYLSLQNGTYTASQAEEAWENQKSEERCHHKSILEDIPKSFPALVRAQKIHAKVGRHGFDWTQVKEVIGKVEEELNELKEAIEEGHGIPHIEHELGDLLFSCCNLGKHLGLSSELSLHKANERFIRRFQRVEELVKQKNTTIEAMTFDELLVIWEQVKQEEY